VKENTNGMNYTDNETYRRIHFAVMAIESIHNSQPKILQHYKRSEMHYDANVALPKKRYSKEEMERIIVEFCNDWRTAEEIANIVNREITYIKNHILPKLSDCLEKKYNVPHHPKQKYRAKRGDDIEN